MLTSLLELLQRHAAQELLLWPISERPQDHLGSLRPPFPFPRAAYDRLVQ